MSYRTRFASVLALGLGIRLWLTFGTHGLQFDLQSYALVEHALSQHPLHAYSLVNSPALLRWPYPTGFFAFLPVIEGLSRLTALAFTELVRLPSVFADLAIALVVQEFLGRRGARPRTRLAATAAVALGPLFIANSGYDGQLDSLAILPAVAALAIWDRTGRTDRRALLAGALIGVGAAMKSFPLLTLIALLPSARSRREVVLLITGALAVPVVALVPFLAVDGHAVLAALRYHSLVGTGGLSLVAQPDLAGIWLGGPYARLTGLSHLLQGNLGLAIMIVALLSASLLILRFRTEPVDAATLLWLTVFAFSVNFGPRYAIWGMPFFLMRQNVRAVVLLQLLLIIPTILLRASPFTDHTVDSVYDVTMILMWAGSLVGAVVFARQLIQSHALRLTKRGVLTAS